MKLGCQAGHFGWAEREREREKGSEVGVMSLAHAREGRARTGRTSSAPSPSLHSLSLFSRSLGKIVSTLKEKEGRREMVVS